MGTNYSRLSLEDEMISRKIKLIDDINHLILSPQAIEREFAEPVDEGISWNTTNPWSNFIKDTCIHLGKRSGGWLFDWNFHDMKYYSNKEELLAFIRSGRVVDEYGEEWEPEAFIKMALEWGQPDGWILNKEYEDMMRKKYPGHITWGEKYYDKIIDGLRVSSSTEFS